MTKKKREKENDHAVINPKTGKRSMLTSSEERERERGKKKEATESELSIVSE